MKHTFSLLLTVFLLSACQDQNFNPDTPQDKLERVSSDFGSLVGDTLTFGGNKKYSSTGSMARSSVNPYLWKASLDTLDFMALSSTDAVGGVIITDWYHDAKNKQKRLKVTVKITDKALRSDALEVIVQKQLRNKGQWGKLINDKKTAWDLEKLVLQRARDLKQLDNHQ